MHLMVLKTFKQVGLKICEVSILLLFMIVSFFLFLLKISKAFGHSKNEHLFYYISIVF